MQLQKIIQNIQNLSIKEIEYLEDYLTNLKNKKLSQSYYNPYEYGSRDVPIQMQTRPMHYDDYYCDPNLLDYMGIDHSINSENNRRNIDVESKLIHQQSTRKPGSKLVSELNRFEYMPQINHENLVWSDNMPRGGYSTRNERIEL